CEDACGPDCFTSADTQRIECAGSGERFELLGPQLGAPGKIAQVGERFLGAGIHDLLRVLLPYVAHACEAQPDCVVGGYFHGYAGRCCKIIFLPDDSPPLSPTLGRGGWYRMCRGLCCV